ncbi:MAG: quinolinate synthase NadA [Nitrospinota bacterium]|nr:quinolinate synthase NadA [Nitrospinota bacterium]MDH5755232.1 quinolinate synthase NadA [Nitrospinota bacterium]
MSLIAEKTTELQQEIRRLVKERNAVMLAHNYQRDEIQQIADIGGDSLALSMEAARTDAEVILFCGVHFMAESAAILSPDKTVLLPHIDAGCPMADMITPEKLREKRAELGPDIPVVTYVNSSAEVKAESDICCTSANAVAVVNSLPGDRVFMTPDMNLAKYVARHTKKKVDWWKGFCPTHHQLKAQTVMEMKQTHPDAKVVAHPECAPDILDLADHICSTSGMYTYAKKENARKFIIATEAGILYRLRLENPDKEFILVSEDMLCPNMKVTTLEDIHEALVEMKHVITVPEDIRLRAKSALDKMLAVPRD